VVRSLDGCVTHQEFTLTLIVIVIIVITFIKTRHRHARSPRGLETETGRRKQKRRPVFASDPFPKDAFSDSDLNRDYVTTVFTWIHRCESRIERAAAVRGDHDDQG